MLFHCAKTFAQNDHYYFFGKIKDDIDGVPISNVTIKFDTTKNSTKSDLNGFFSLRIPFDKVYKNKSRIIADLSGSGGVFINDTIVINSTEAKQNINFRITTNIQFYSSSPNYGYSLTRCSESKINKNDTSIYFIYGNIYEQNTKTPIDNVIIEIIDEKQNIIFSQDCFIYNNGFYNFRLPKSKNKKYTMHFKKENFKDIVVFIDLNNEFIICENIELEYER